MTTTKTKTTPRNTTAKSATPAAIDAIELLKADHKAVRELFGEYEALAKDEADEEEKHALAAQICAALTVHAQIEEELFYPALREAIEAQALIDEAEVEHGTARDLIAQIEGMEAGEDLFDAKVTVLGEYVNHHVEEEEKEMFKLAKKSDLDLAGLGVAMADRRAELNDELGDA